MYLCTNIPKPFFYMKIVTIHEEKTFGGVFYKILEKKVVTRPKFTKIRASDDLEIGARGGFFGCSSCKPYIYIYI